MKQLQEWYPDPPLVILLSNNEHAKLSWKHVETDQRYLAKYGKRRDDDFKRKVVGDGWIERYRALQQGMRAGLVNPQWQKAAVFVGYDAFGPPHVGRWSGWPESSLHTTGRIAPDPLMWDGGSPSYYAHNWNPSTDYTGWSPQVEFQNLVFMQNEAYRLNPKFWFELSTWDGCAADRDPTTSGSTTLIAGSVSRPSAMLASCSSACGSRGPERSANSGDGRSRGTRTRRSSWRWSQRSTGCMPTRCSANSAQGRIGCQSRSPAPLRDSHSGRVCRLQPMVSAGRRRQSEKRRLGNSSR